MLAFMFFVYNVIDVLTFWQFSFCRVSVLLKPFSYMFFMRRRDHQPFAKTSAAGRLHCVRDTQDVSPGARMTPSRTDGEFLKILKTSTLFNKQMIETMNKYMTSLKQSPIHVLFTSRRFSVGRWWDGAGFLPSRVFKILRLGSPGSKLSWDREMETYTNAIAVADWDIASDFTCTKDMKTCISVNQGVFSSRPRGTPWKSPYKS